MLLKGLHKETNAYLNAELDPWIICDADQNVAS